MLLILSNGIPFHSASSVYLFPKENKSFIFTKKSMDF